MIYDLERHEDDGGCEPILRRVFLREPGWRVGLKVGSEKVFCTARP